MGVTPEQKLVVKHTFLEYVCAEEAPSNCESACQGRQRSWTEPNVVQDGSYGQVKTEVVRDSDSSTSDDNDDNDDDGDKFDEPGISTPDLSPLHCPSHRNPANWNVSDASWEGQTPNQASGYMNYEQWTDQAQYMNGQWWTPVAFDVNTGLPINYCDAVSPEQFQLRPEQMQPHCSPSLRSSVLTPIAENDTEVSFSQLPAIAEVVPVAQAPRANVVKDNKTTVMLRGVPETYTRTDVLRILGAEGFFGRFNFVYLPVDFKSHKNLGYALINLVSPKEAERMRKRFEGFCSWDVAGGSVCTVAWCSPQQGLDAHVERYRNSPVMHESVPEEWRPMLLRNGVQIQFPPPTVKIKAPRLKGTQ